VDLLAAGWNKARAQTALKSRLDELGMAPPDRFASPEALVAFLKTENARLGKIIRDANIKAD
jgi:tripartite-type tricarboxylate transporter receptor subunit TctC